MESMRPVAAAILLSLTLLSGCLDDGESTATPPAFADLDGLEVTQQPGAVSTAFNNGTDDVELAFPAGTLLLASNRWVPAPANALTLTPGGRLTFLPSPGDATFNLTLDGKDVLVPASPAAPILLDGHPIVNWTAYVEANFPDRSPGNVNFPPSMHWAGDALKALGYDVDVDPLGTESLPNVSNPVTGDCIPEQFVSGQRICAQALANVVATKAGSDPNGPVVVIGGHYDIVPQVVYGAFDNTMGALSVLALAQALAPYQFGNVTVVLGMWSGEEQGLLGSTAWLASHPELRPRISAYWNFDTIGLTFPGPVSGEPAPLSVHVGPEGGAPGVPFDDPLQAGMRAWVDTLWNDWMRQPATFNGTATYEVGGAVENLPTTDHIGYMAAGIPAFVPESNAYVGQRLNIHTNEDSLANITKMALFGTEAEFESAPLEGEALATAQEALARSFEPYLQLAFYHLVLNDAGLYQPYEGAA